MKTIEPGIRQIDDEVFQIEITVGRSRVRRRVHGPLEAARAEREKALKLLDEEVMIEDQRRRQLRESSKRSQEKARRLDEAVETGSPFCDRPPWIALDRMSYDQFVRRIVRRATRRGFVAVYGLQEPEKFRRAVRKSAQAAGITGIRTYCSGRERDGAYCVLVGFDPFEFPRWWHRPLSDHAVVVRMEPVFSKILPTGADAVEAFVDYPREGWHAAAAAFCAGRLAECARIIKAIPEESR